MKPSIMIAILVGAFLPIFVAIFSSNKYQAKKNKGKNRDEERK